MPFENHEVINIIQEACSNTAELPWLEFKKNNANPQEIGEYVSALSNTAALYSRNYGFLIWGIDDETRKIVGTTFDHAKTKQGNQPLELWISTQLDPQVQFYFHNTIVDGRNVVLLEITAAHSVPVKFRGIEYIRIGSSKKKLQDFHDTERELWASFSKKSFEELLAIENVTSATVLQLLDFNEYFEMLSLDLPSSNEGIIARLQDEKMIVPSEAGNYNITNFGALLYAQQLSAFSSLERKAVRIIRYYGNDKVTSASKEIVSDKGYAGGFEDVIRNIMSMIPEDEIFESGIRRNFPKFPEPAVRELIGNLMIHQDLHMRGTNPMVEIFDNRIEVTNPGAPLIEKDRFVDFPPVSRNEKIAGFMRRVRICEERGIGFDRIVLQTELQRLPPPDIEIYKSHTKVVIYAHKEFSAMSRGERQLACYLHACLKRVNRDYMTNSSLRERFAIDAKNSSMISRLLNETQKAGLIKESYDSTKGKFRRFLPYWA